jgi:hypothetical protein
MQICYYSSVKYSAKILISLLLGFQETSLLNAHIKASLEASFN